MSDFDNRARDRKISQFPAQQAVPADSVFTFVSGGVNYKVTFPNLLAALGATGTLQDEGDPLGAPVLDDQGGVYGIRNIESGPGILATISPQNGVYLQHNFTVNTAGAPLIVDPTALSPVFRSLVAGQGISISTQNGSIRISASGAPTSTRTVVVNTITDFPEAVGGIITLEENTQYFIFNNISLGTTRIVMANNTSIEGADSSVITMSYSGTGDMFTALNSTVRFGRITLSAPSGRILRFTSLARTEGCQFNDMTISTCQDIALVEGASYVYLFDTYCSFESSGVTVIDIVSDFLAIPNSFFISNGGSVLNIASANSIQTLMIHSNYVRLNDATSRFITGNGDANIVLSAGVSDCRIANTGGGTALSGVSGTNLKWLFSGNDIIPDTAPRALVTLDNNATVTTISGINTPTKVLGTWTAQAAQQFTTDVTGRIAYSGQRPFTAAITAVLTCLMATGGNKNIHAYVAINGTVLPSSGIQVSPSSSVFESLSLVWVASLNAGDYVEVFVENNSDTTGIVVRDASFRVA